MIDGRRINIVMGYVGGMGPMDMNFWVDVGVHLVGFVIDFFLLNLDEWFKCVFIKIMIGYSNGFYMFSIERVYL